MRLNTDGVTFRPLRGGKGALWEGGIRANTFASGGWLPSAVRGTKYAGLSAAWDWYATLSELAGIDPADVRAAAAGLPPIDSISLVDVLLGRTEGDDGMHSSHTRGNRSSSSSVTSKGKGSSSRTRFGGNNAPTNRRTMLLLGTEPTDGYPLGSTVGGVLTQDSGAAGPIWKLIVGTCQNVHTKSQRSLGAWPQEDMCHRRVSLPQCPGCLYFSLVPSRRHGCRR